MSWYEKLLDSAKDVAPTVAGTAAIALGGGNPALGALVSSIMGRVIGRPGVDLEEAAEAILGSPEALSEFRARMREAEIKELQIRTKDVQNARSLLPHSKGPIAISALIVAAFSILLFLVMFVAIPEASQAIAFMLMGTLAAEFTRTTTFWLGSSQSSKEKDTLISRFAAAAEIDQKVRRNNGSKD